MKSKEQNKRKKHIENILMAAIWMGLKGEYSRQRKECAQRPCHVKEASCPENRKFYEADVLGKGREQKLEGCSKCGFWKSLGRLYLVEDSGLYSVLKGEQGGILLWVKRLSFGREGCMSSKRDCRYRKQRRLFI